MHMFYYKRESNRSFLIVLFFLSLITDVNVGTGKRDVYMFPDRDALTGDVPDWIKNTQTGIKIQGTSFKGKFMKAIQNLIMPFGWCSFHFNLHSHDSHFKFLCCLNVFLSNFYCVSSFLDFLKVSFT